MAKPKKVKTSKSGTVTVKPKQPTKKIVVKNPNGTTRGVVKSNRPIGKFVLKQPSQDSKPSAQKPTGSNPSTSQKKAPTSSTRPTTTRTTPPRPTTQDSKPSAARPHGSNPSTSLTKAQKVSERQAIKADRKSVRDQARKISDRTGEKRTTYISKSPTGYNLNNRAARALDSKPSAQKPHGAPPKTTEKPMAPKAKKVIKTVRKKSRYF